MKPSKPLFILTALIFCLALFVAGMGVFWQTPGAPVQARSTRGEAVTLQGSGLYKNDTISTAAQERGADLATLFLGLPLLAVSAVLTARGSFRGWLLLTGTLGYFLYTYMSMSFLSAYNPLFLVYVALFALSLYAFIISITAVDFAGLPGRFADSTPRGWIAGVLFGAGGFLVLAWLGRILPPLFQGRDPVLENTTTLVIQAMDLALIVPLAFVGGILLLRRSAWGYLLASVAVMKLLTMGTSVSAMGFSMLVSGAAVSPVELAVFPTLTLLNVALAFFLLRSVKPSGG